MIATLLPLLLVAAPPGATAEQADCRHTLLPASIPAGERRAVTSSDLVTLRDFGRQDVALAGDAPFSLSPDGRLAALVIRRGDPLADRYCIGVVVVAIDGATPPRLVDIGGDFMIDTSDVRGIPDLPIGIAASVTPRWSPDGRWLAYLRRDGGVTRAWRARADGTSARSVSHFDVDVRDVRWASNGALVVRTRPVPKEASAAALSEERSGYLYDKRFWTLSLTHPKPGGAAPFVEQMIDVSDGKVIAGPVPSTPEKRAAGVSGYVSDGGNRAWIAADDPSVVLGHVHLVVEHHRRRLSCTEPICFSPIGSMLWHRNTLYLFASATPENGGTITLYRWRMGRDRQPRHVFSTIDALLGCQFSRDRVVCARESATRPRRLVTLDPSTGRDNPIYDPNPEFSQLIRGGVERLRWRDADDVATYADLVLPASHRPGDKHPLIVVQYQSRGFLRGGIGDEFPIHVLAERGFAVLSMERTPFYSAGRGTRSFDEAQKLGLRDFAERRRVLSSIETGIQVAIDRGAVDAAKIGITGVSDGAATVQFALSNSNLFKAAAMGSCCDDPSTARFAVDPGYAAMVEGWGFPPPGRDDPAFWRRYSIAANVDRIKVPILLQLPDDEFRFGLETFQTLDYHRRPVEMYVFADEYHVKWRPAHRLASYERVVDWFDFWLNGRVDPDPAKAAQAARWRLLATRQSR